MSIKIACPGCGKTLRAPDEAAGKRARCPQCKTVVTLVAPVEEVSPALEVEEADPVGPVPVSQAAATAVPEHAPVAVVPSVVAPVHADAAAAPAVADVARSSCPMCGELIPVAAIKCRFCGHMLDLAQAAAAGVQRRATESGWGAVRGGLACFYFAILGIILIAIGTMMVAAVLTWISPGRRLSPSDASMIALFTVPAIVAAGLAMLVGQALCIGVPVSSARLLAIGTLGCTFLNFACSFAAEVSGEPLFQAIGGLLNFSGHVMFVLFLRSIAAYLGDVEMLGRTKSYLIFIIVFAAAVIACVAMLPILTTVLRVHNDIVAIFALTFAVSTLVFLIVAILRFLRLLNATRKLIRERSQTGLPVEPMQVGYAHSGGESGAVDG